MSVLLNYLAKTEINPSTAVASTLFIEDIAIVVKSNLAGTDNTVVLLTDSSQIISHTDNLEVVQAFNSGKNKVYLILKDDLIIGSLLDANLFNFFSVIISTDYDLSTDLSALTKGTFDGVFYITSSDSVILDGWVVGVNQSGFNNSNGAFGSIHFVSDFTLAHSGNFWRNRQYIPAPSSVIPSAVTEGVADTFFDNRYSFYVQDLQLGNKLGFAVAGGRSISIPYMFKQLEIDLQNITLAYLSELQPLNTNTQRNILRTRVSNFLATYVETGQIEQTKVNVEASQEKFIVFSQITFVVNEAWWRTQYNIQEIST